MPAGSALGSITSPLKGKPVIVTPPLVDYSDAVQDRAADELEALQPPCSRDVIVGDCSVAAHMILDYATLREKIRAATADDGTLRDRSDPATATVVLTYPRLSSWSM